MGIDSYSPLITSYYTISFGILLIACLLLFLFGFETLTNPVVVLVATILPLSFSLALITTYFSEYHIFYLIFSLFGFLMILFSRSFLSEKTATFILAFVHGIAGLIIFFLPIYLIIDGQNDFQYLFVSLGSALIGLSGLLLVFLKVGKPILSKNTIYNLFPLILLMMTITFLIGMSAEK